MNSLYGKSEKGKSLKDRCPKKKMKEGWSQQVVTLLPGDPSLMAAELPLLCNESYLVCFVTVFFLKSKMLNCSISTRNSLLGTSESIAWPSPVKILFYNNHNDDSAHSTALTVYPVLSQLPFHGALTAAL